MELNLTDWSSITRKTIKSVWYMDYMLQPGWYDEHLKVYCINEGYIILETTESEWFKIQIDTEWTGHKLEGLQLYQISDTETADFHRIKLNQDKIWSQISNKTVKHFQLFHSAYLIGKKEHP